MFACANPALKATAGCCGASVTSKRLPSVSTCSSICNEWIQAPLLLLLIALTTVTADKAHVSRSKFGLAMHSQKLFA
jgi:hypothetical protein